MIECQYLCLCSLCTFFLFFYQNYYSRQGGNNRLHPSVCLFVRQSVNRISRNFSSDFHETL